MCHAPIVIPAIAGSRAAQCDATTGAMREVAASIARSQPEVLVIVSPHAPRHPTHWGLADGPRLHGDFGRFGHPGLEVSLPGAPDACARVMETARQRGLGTWSPDEGAQRALDHGTAVPLYFVREAGFAGPTLLVCLPYPGTDTEERLGEAIAEASGDARWAVLASGDMSHRLQEGAPAGFDPRAREFDAHFVTSLRERDLRRACSPPPELQQLAAEDVIDSARVAAAASGYAGRGLNVVHYEGPFGVGYCEAILHDDAAAAEGKPANDPAASDVELAGGGERALLSVAREAVDAMTRNVAYRPQAIPPPLATSRGVFVTLRDASGRLRGCIGHMQAQHERLVDEVADCARAAASSDPRFPPVTAPELRQLSIEISLLTPPQPVDDLSTLDAKRYGVMVSHRGRRGVLLPDIAGVETVEDQLRIAGDKGGLPPGEPWTVERFEVEKLAEH